MHDKILRGMLLAGLAAALAACESGGGGPLDPSGAGNPPPLPVKTELRIAAVDLQMADLAGEADLSRYTRADLVVLHPWSYWEDEAQAGALDRLRAVNPDIRIIAYFSPKIVRADWAAEPRDTHPYSYDLYQAGVPYLCRTTAGDTVSDWPGAFLVDFTDPQMRRRRLDVLARYQGRFGNRFDGIFWDNFAPRLWIGPDVTGMEGEPDMDGDGVGHWDDADEMAAFLAAQEAWALEVRARFGEGFIQIANGTRGAFDADFAGLFDGLYQEVYPGVPYGQDGAFLKALDPAVANNMWELVARLRTRNGGPWLIPTNIANVGGFYDQNGAYRRVNTGDLNRVVALLTGATSAHFDFTGMHQAALPPVELDLGEPLGETIIEGALLQRAFERGTVRVQMETGNYPVPFRYWIRRGDGRNVQVLDPPYAYP